MTRGYTGYHFLLTLIVFFSVIFAVNGVMIFKAVTTFRGEDADKAYLKGTEFNETLADHAIQARLGWRATVDAQRADGGGARLTVTLADRSGSPVANLSLTALLKHPSDAERDREVSLRPVSKGVYVGQVPGVQSGIWDIVVTAQNAPTTPFEADRRIWLR